MDLDEVIHNLRGDICGIGELLKRLDFVNYVLLHIYRDMATEDYPLSREEAIRFIGELNTHLTDLLKEGEKWIESLKNNLEKLERRLKK